LCNNIYYNTKEKKKKRRRRIFGRKKWRWIENGERCIVVVW
jgi:hypothetical protein